MDTEGLLKSLNAHEVDYVAPFDDLIRMKEAAGREKDKEDLKILLKIRDRI